MSKPETTLPQRVTATVIEGMDYRRDRTPKDYAIEFGEYLARAAERFMAEQNRAMQADELPDAEYWLTLQSAIYEFRKRAARVGD